MKPVKILSYRDYLDMRGTCRRGWGVKLLHEQEAETRAAKKAGDRKPPHAAEGKRTTATCAFCETAIPLVEGSR